MKHPLPKACSPARHKRCGRCWQRHANSAAKFCKGLRSPAGGQGSDLDSGQTIFADRDRWEFEKSSRFNCYSPQTGRKLLQTTDAAPVQTPQASKGVDVSLLENVEIDVTLQFGERRLPLREIGELRSGSVVELDKYVQDPAELLLGDRVVARGEVVIVDGNYGLRITEVV